MVAIKRFRDAGGKDQYVRKTALREVRILKVRPPPHGPCSAHARAAVHGLAATHRPPPTCSCTCHAAAHRRHVHLHLHFCAAHS